VLYPTDIEEKLGFDKVRGLIKEKCASSLGTAIVDQMRFTANYEVVFKLLNQTNEFQKIIVSGDPFPSSNYIDVNNLLKKSATEGAFLSETELLDISKSLETILKCLAFLKLKKEGYPQLNALSENISIDVSIGSSIAEKIDKDARVKDNASKSLLDIRNSLRNRYNQVRKSLQTIYKKAVEDGFVPSGASITVRDGRMVIPVLAEYKKRISGFIHDESASGGTIFMEPTTVLEGNNEIRELEYAEKREVVKILTQLTNIIRLNLPDLKEGYSFLGKVDFIRAKARFANEVNGCMPKVIDRPMVNWKDATHPLLRLALAKEGRDIVPLSISLNPTQRIIVISGPNAGGKSVSLKTVGLIQYMLQCGLLVPLDEKSETGIFDNIFIDIGDEQSLENDLSTYSSHLKSMKFFIEKSGKQTLCLIDEFGTGTDPQFGGPIAEAILKELHSIKTFGVITTHYSNIKNFTERTDGLINGAMRFDMNKLEPLFQLDIGKPGSSFSLEVARKTGLPKELLDYAKAAIGDKNIDVDDLLMKLERQKQLVKDRDEKLHAREKDVKQLEHDYKTLLQKLEQNKKEIITKAKEEASRLLKDTNREIEKTIRHIKANSAHKEETKKARERLQNLKDKVEAPKMAVKPLRVNRDDLPLAPGDLVKLVDQEVTGTILAIKGKDAEVQIGLLKSKIRLERLERISKGKDKALQKELSRSTHGLNMTDKLVNFNTTLDIRGKRAEEVMAELDRFLDDALLFGLDEVKILHGKGNGVLREIVRNHTKAQSFILSTADEHMDRGGAGITVVNLK
jgi:DNA mismatch repair protein MutS2